MFTNARKVKSDENWKVFLGENEMTEIIASARAKDGGPFMIPEFENVEINLDFGESQDKSTLSLFSTA